MDAPGPRRAAPERLRLMSAAAALVTLLLPPVASVAGSATAASTISLDGTWALSSDAGHRLKGVVPGDLITDLENARIVQDPLYELGWLNNNTNLAPPWTAHVWTYSTTFTAPPSSLLVFGGIKMCAQILVNGKPALFATDQFLRYTLPVPAGDVKLEVVFDPTKDVGGRYMASSGGWDFEPYTNTREGNISARNFSIPRTFSRGIWQSVTVQTGLAVLHVVPEIFYTGEYATARLADGATNFTVNVTVHVHSHAATTLDATVSVAGSSKALSKVAVPAGESALSMTLDVDGPALWWPQGHGAQILHSLNVTLQPATGQPVHASRSVGFRTLALVTGNDTDAAYRQAAAAEEGSDDFTMFVRVNGEAIYARGANMVALDQLEGRTTDANYRRLVQSAAEAGMNMIRIWGGGSFLTSAYYSACDQLGVLVYHDMMFAVETGQPHLAYVSDTVEKELRHQIRRLSSHPSIAIWDGCNECRVVMHKDDLKPKPDPYYPDGTELYATFVLQTVVEEDKSRIVWPSCPASGWASGVHKLTGLPTGGPLVTRNDSAKGGKIEVHGPYRQGSGISSINPGGGDYLSQPPALPKPGGETGTQHPSVFISEFGSVGMSSFESMSATLAPEHWSVHGGTTEVDQCHGQHTAWCTGGNVMGYRNHMTDNQIHAAFGNSTLLNLSAVGAAAFQEQLYKSMMGQALDMKREMEEQRAVNSFGMLVWQLGEVWPTGGWGSLEYAAERPGQIPGGRWKPLHSLYAQGLMRDVFTACGVEGTRGQHGMVPIASGNVSCYLVNDGHAPFSGSVTVTAIDLATGASDVIHHEMVSLPAGPGVRKWFAPDAGALPDPTTHALVVSDSEGTEMLASLAPLNAMALKPAKVSCTVGGGGAAVAAPGDDDADDDGKEAEAISVTCTSDAVAVYVVLTTAAHGRFEPNAFVLGNSSREVKFLPWNGNGTTSKEDVEGLLKSSLRVDHAAKWPLYPPAPPPPPKPKPKPAPSPTPAPPVPKHWKTCKFKHNMDWNEGARAPQQPAADPVACCALCSKTPSCAASTFHNSSAGAGGCFLKSAGDVAKGLKAATKACVACVPFEQ